MNYLTQVAIYHAWNILANSDKDGRHRPDAGQTADSRILWRWPMRDANDGLKDGLISDPWNFHLDPSVTECKEGQDKATCLTPAQVHTAQLIYQGARDSNGTPLDLGGPLPGSELQWTNGGYVADVSQNSRTISAHLATFSLKYLVFAENLPLNFDIGDIKFDEATFLKLAAMHPLYDALNPDLSQFDGQGHKIIFWSGLADGSTVPTNIVAYYEAMQSSVGKERAQRFARLYLFPGGYHGNGNPGPIDCDLLSAVIGWVEKNVAPYRLISYYLPSSDQKGGKYGPYGNALNVAKSYRSRPVYPYPEIAHYKGSGSIDEAENFDAEAPPMTHPPFRWIGIPSFLTPVPATWCGWSGMTFSCGTERK